MGAYAYRRIHARHYRLGPVMMTDSIDEAMLVAGTGIGSEGSVVELDGISLVQYTPEETLAISEARYYIRKYMGAVLRALVSYRSRFGLLYQFSKRH
jgi:hypothetical protein